MTANYQSFVPIMLAFCLMLSVSRYAKNNAVIIGWSLVVADGALANRRLFNSTQLMSTIKKSVSLTYLACTEWLLCPWG